MSNTKKLLTVMAIIESMLGEEYLNDMQDFLDSEMFNNEVKDNDKNNTQTDMGNQFICHTCTNI